MIFDEQLTPREVAMLLKRSVETLAYWRHRGSGPRHFTINRRVRYMRSDVDAWVQEQREAPERS